MKVAIICDTHYGLRNGSQTFHNICFDWVENSFLPEIKKRNIKQIIHLGDFTDRRSSVPTLTVDLIKQKFLNPLRDLGCNIILTIGNHDCYYMDRNNIHSLKLFEEYDNIDVYWEQPEEIEIDGLNIILVPWIMKDNEEISIKKIANSKAKVCMGHLELQGFQMHRNIESKHGHSSKLFEHFEKVFSGHFHAKSEQKNITYCGSPYQMTWADAGDERGFHIFDTETLELEFIPNPKQRFIHMEMDSDIPDDLSNCFVRLHTKQKDEKSDVDAFVKEIKQKKPSDLQVVEEKIQYKSKNNVEVDEKKDVLVMIDEYVNSTDLSEKEKTSVFSILQEAYNNQK